MNYFSTFTELLPADVKQSSRSFQKIGISGHFRKLQRSKPLLLIPKLFENSSGTLGSMAMVEVLQIRALEKFTPFLRILQAYDAENLGKSAGFPYNRCFAFTITVIVVMFMCASTLGVWYLIEFSDDMGKVVISAPVMLTLLKELISYLSLFAKHRFVDKTIAWLQKIVDQRKSIQLIF